MKTESLLGDYATTDQQIKRRMKSLDTSLG
jgi:hypothetical protein